MPNENARKNEKQIVWPKINEKQISLQKHNEEVKKASKRTERDELEYIYRCVCVACEKKNEKRYVWNDDVNKSAGFGNSGEKKSEEKEDHNDCLKAFFSFLHGICESI